MNATIASEDTRTVPLLCPECREALTRGNGHYSCKSCGREYPLLHGIPRLIATDFYWGEIDRANAVAFVEDARQLGWRNAVAQRFQAGSDASISILDWQRASWIPLLALPQDAVVLDIGSGYGALTHALAANYREVHSIEAIDERVEFTGLRMQQEGFTNVHLVQGSALRLPYPDASFDAVVVNGILEWIGDWDPEGSPRDAQLRFLKRVYSLLKPGGTLLVGIENRVAYDAFKGDLDHSGLPYTSLLPRPIASLALRMFAKRHHRMEQPSRSYRTYTYSESGYRRLFQEAGFASIDPYWAVPGYNQPYRLSPTDSSSVESSLKEAQLDPSIANRLGFGGRLKRVLASVGVLKYVLPEFIFIVRRDTHDRSPLQSSLPITVDSNAQFHLSTYKFAAKTTIRISSRAGADVVAQFSTLAPGSSDALALEFETLQHVSKHVIESNSGNFRVPNPLGSARVGGQSMSAQSLVPGQPLSVRLFEASQEARLKVVEEVLPSVIKAATAVPDALAAVRNMQSGTRWLAPAQSLLDESLTPRVELLAKKYRARAHGDFTIENILLDRNASSGALAIIDWESASSDVPPLYDLVTFCLSILPAIEVTRDVAAQFLHAGTAQAYTAFVKPGDWSRLLSHTLKPALSVAQVDANQAGDILLDSLIFRVGYLAARGSNTAPDYAQIALMISRHLSELRMSV